MAENKKRVVPASISAVDSAGYAINSRGNRTGGFSQFEYDKAKELDRIAGNRYRRDFDRKAWYAQSDEKEVTKKKSTTNRSATSKR